MCSVAWGIILLVNSLTFITRFFFKCLVEWHKKILQNVKNVAKIVKYFNTPVL